MQDHTTTDRIFLDVRSAAYAVSLSERKLRELIEQGLVPVTRVGSKILIRPEDLRAIGRPVAPPLRGNRAGAAGTRTGSHAGSALGYAAAGARQEEEVPVVEDGDVDV